VSQLYQIPTTFQISLASSLCGTHQINKRCGVYRTFHINRQNDRHSM